MKPCVGRFAIRRILRDRQDRARWRRVVIGPLTEILRRFDNGEQEASIRSHRDAWMRELRANGMSDCHIENAERVLKRFSQELADFSEGAFSDDPTLSAITADILKAWRQMRLASVSSGTVNREIGVLKTYARWCMRARVWNPQPAEMAWIDLRGLKYRRKPIQSVTTAEARDIFSRLPLHVRLPALAMWASADRPTAILSLTWGDIHWPQSGCEGWVSLMNRKGGPERSRIVPLKEGDFLLRVLLRAMEEYRLRRGRTPTHHDRIFLSKRTGTPWDVKTFASCYRYYMARSGRRGRHVRLYQVTRHSVGSLIMEKGANLAQAQMLLGHADAQTTNRYLHVHGDDAKSAHAMLNSETMASFSGIIDDL